MEREPNPEAGAEEVKPIDALPEKLGFIETTDLAELRGVLVEAIDSGSNRATRLMTVYQELGGEVVDELPNAERPRAQIGLIVQMGLIRRDGGRADQYMQDLEDAIDYAWQVGLDAEVAVLEAALAEVKATLE